MTHGGKTLVCVLGGLVLCTGALAINSDVPYAGILERNVFGLKPPPPPVDPNAAASNAPPPNVTLAGITTIFGNKRAILKTAATSPPKPGVPPANDSYILAEGQRDGDIEVVQIDERAGAVKIRLAGNLVDINFEKNGVKLPSTPMPMAMPVPGMPNPAGGMIPMPAGAVGIPAPGASPFGSKTIPQRTLRMPGSTTGASATAAPGSAGIAVAGLNAGGVALPAFGSSSSGGTAASEVAQPQLTAEEQAIAIEVERERHKARIQSGQMAPPPITVLTPPGSVGTIQPTPADPGMNPVVPRFRTQ